MNAPFWIKVDCHVDNFSEILIFFSTVRIKIQLSFGILSAHSSLIKTNLNCQLKLCNSQLFQRTKQLFAMLLPATPAVSEEWFLTATGTNNEFLINQEFSHQISVLPTARSRCKTQSAQ